MNRILLILVVCFLGINSGIAQVFPLLPKYYQPIDSSVIASKNKEAEKEDKEILMQKHKKLSYDVTVGGAYSSFGSGMSMMSSYIAPSINYQVNSKLSVSIDGIIMKNSMNGLESRFGAGSQYSYNSSPHNYGISGSAFYQLNDKWTIYGDGAYLENQSVFNDYRAEMYSTDYKTVSLGIGYKFNDKVSFNVQYRYSNGLDPAYNFSSPYNRFGRSPFNSRYSPFDSGYGFWGY